MASRPSPHPKRTSRRYSDKTGSIRQADRAPRRRGLFALFYVVFSNRFYICLRCHTVFTTVYCIADIMVPFLRANRSAVRLPLQYFRRFHAVFAVLHSIHHIWYLAYFGHTIPMLFYQNVTTTASNWLQHHFIKILYLCMHQPTKSCRRAPLS